MQHLATAQWSATFREAGGALLRDERSIMRISLVSLHFSEYSARLALALADEHSVQLHLAAGNARDELSPALLAELTDRLEMVLHPRITRANSLARGWAIARRIRSFRPDVIHAQEASDWATAVVRIFAFRPPFVYTVHDPVPHSGHDAQVAQRNRLPRALLRGGANAIVVHGKSLVPLLLTAMPRLRRRVHVVAHGLLGASQPPAQEVGAEFLFFGRIETYKGLDVLLDAVEILALQGAPVHLHIVGRGSALEQLRSRIPGCGVVTLDEAFVPADGVASLMRRARAVVLPYRNATQSGVVATAFASGATVIASDVGALSDILEDGVNALMVPPGDASALAAAMARLATDDDLVRTLRSGAARTAQSHLSWSGIARATTYIYHLVCRKGGNAALAPVHSVPGRQR